MFDGVEKAIHDQIARALELVLLPHIDEKKKNGGWEERTDARGVLESEKKFLETEDSRVLPDSFEALDEKYDARFDSYFDSP